MFELTDDNLYDINYSIAAHNQSIPDKIVFSEILI